MGALMVAGKNGLFTLHQWRLDIESYLLFSILQFPALKTKGIFEQKIFSLLHYFS
jgi:hypothetical protein